MMLLGEPIMNLSHPPAVPKSELTNVHDDFQSKAAAAQGHAPGRLRGSDPMVSSTVRIGAMVSHPDDQVATTQKDDIFAPEWIAALQNLPTVLTSSLFWPIRTFGNLAVVFSSSHQYTSLARDLSKNRFYSRQEHVGGILPLLKLFCCVSCSM